jgi:hypothetical protein
MNSANPFDKAISQKEQRAAREAAHIRDNNERLKEAYRELDVHRDRLKSFGVTFEWGTFTYRNTMRCICLNRSPWTNLLTFEHGNFIASGGRKDDEMERWTKDLTPTVAGVVEAIANCAVTEPALFAPGRYEDESYIPESRVQRGAKNRIIYAVISSLLLIVLILVILWR